MPTTARGVWTPSDTDAVDFTTDLATMAGTIDLALDIGANALKGTASQRTAYTSTAINGMLWQDTDGIKMIWRRDTSTTTGWAPAVMRWRGTTAQMNAFGPTAPDGFTWYSSTDGLVRMQYGGNWMGPIHPYAMASGVETLTGTGGPEVSKSISFPSGRFTATPVVVATSMNRVLTGAADSITVTSFEGWLRHTSLSNWSSNNRLSWTAFQMTPTSGAG